MDWLRRNWPDLLIGIALVAVIAGIVATLLTGGSFFPLGPGQQGSPTAPNVSPVTPPSGPAVIPEDGVATAPPTRITPETPLGGTPDPTVTDEPAPGAVGEPGPGAIVVLPPTTNAGAATSGVGEAASEDEAIAPTQPNAASAADGAAAPPVPRVVEGDAVPTAPYRVSVGAFSGEVNAQRQADVFREAGFPVFLGRQGNLVLVLVGPYDTQTEAEQAVSRIRTGEFGVDPVIYRYQPDTVAGAAAQTAPAATEADTAPPEDTTADTLPELIEANDAAEAEATEAAAPETSPGGVFLQVGAYANRESAQPQIDRLEALDFTVTERVESGLVKLLVGPFEGEALAQARTQLANAGVESFPRQ